MGDFEKLEECLNEIDRFADFAAKKIDEDIEMINEVLGKFEEVTRDLSSDLDETLVSTREMSELPLRRDESNLKCEDCVACYTPEADGYDEYRLAWCDEQKCFIDRKRLIEDWCDFSVAEIA